MKYKLELSLQKIALIKIASQLWNHSDIRELIEKCYGTEKEWKNLEEKVITKVLKLSEFGQFKEKILGFIRPIGLQILKWTKYHFKNYIAQELYLSVHTPAEFSWSPHGTINRKETAILLIKDRNVDVFQRFNLHLIYCLESNVHEPCDDIIGIINEEMLVSFWLRIRPTVNRSQQLGPCGYAFQIAVKYNNKVAAEYFLQKLSPSERKICLIKAMKTIPDIEVLSFLLAQASEDQYLKLFQSNPCAVVVRIFDWPYMCFYLETAKRFWDFLPAYHYCIYPLMALVMSKIINNFEHCIYNELFRELWQCVCKRFGAVLIASINIEFLLMRLLEIKDKRNIGLMFRSASPGTRRDFISSVSGLYISKKLVMEKEWDLLEFFIQECLCLKSELSEYKEILKEYASDCNVNAEIDEFFFKIDDCM